MFKVDIEKLPFYEEIILKKVEEQVREQVKEQVEIKLKEELEERTIERLYEIAKKLLELGMSLESISNTTGLSIEKIKEIEASLNKE